MRRITALMLVTLALSAGVARAASFGIGAFGGMSIPVLQDDTDRGTMYGLRVPVKLVPLVTIEPYYAASNLGDKTTTVAGLSYTRQGFDETAFGANAMLTMGGPISFYPFAGLGQTKLKRTGFDQSFPTYNFGLGLGISPMPNISIHIRCELQAVSLASGTSRKFGNATIGASYALFSKP